MSLNSRKVAIIGSGLIGRSWAMLFSSFGYQCQLYDTNPECLDKAIELIKADLSELCAAGLARGSLSLDEHLALISTTPSLQDCLKGVCHVQESVFDNLELKQGLHEQIDQLLEEDNSQAAICSSTSIHLPSKVFARVQRHKDQCLVAHPVNPPTFVRLVEIIACPETREEIIIRTRITMDELGQKPVVLRKEVSAFALNRLQYAVFQEAFRLVHDGVMTPQDVDTVVSEGLGPRYAFMGPWMTAHLNAHGMADYLDRYAEGIYRVSQDCQPLLKLEGEAAQQVVDAMLCEVGLDKLEEKRQWRDKCLRELSQLKDRMGTM